MVADNLYVLYEKIGSKITKRSVISNSCKREGNRDVAASNQGTSGNLSIRR